MFFKRPAFGLDVSDYSIEIISLEGSVENPRLLAVAREILEPGIVEDGQILKKEKLENSIQNLIKNPKFGKIKHPLCGYPKFIFALPESKCFISIFDLPENLKENEKLEHLKSRATQTFPFPLKDLYFDFKIDKREALLVAVLRKIVDDYLEIFKNCHLQPLALEIESLSLARALIENVKQITLIADIGARTTNFSIFDVAELRLSFSLPVAGNQFTQAISEKLNISQDEAEKFKKEIGLNPQPKEGKVFLILQKEIQKIIAEINKIVKYFQEKTGQSIEKIILAGGSAAMPYLPEYLAENLFLPVVIGDPWVKINIDILKKKEYFKEALEINPIFYSTVIGVTLRGLSKNPKTAGINLLSKGREKSSN